MKSIFTILSFILFPFIGICQTASFTFQSSNVNFCSPDSITFTPTTSQTPVGYTWTFGNGLPTSNSTSPKVSYAVPGTYTVKLVVVFSNTVVETMQTITINPSPTVTLVPNKSKLCRPDSITFTAATTGAISSYIWTFGDGSTLTTSTPIIKHYYATYDTFMASVKVINQFGCNKVSNSQTILVAKIFAEGFDGPDQGCFPITVNFVQNITTLPGDFVTSYAWDYGDNSPITSTPVGLHTYTSAGTFSPILSIVTNDGCTQSVEFRNLIFGSSPTLTAATPTKLVYCASETASFTAVSTTANTYKWEYGDGDKDSIPSATATHKYTSLGIKTVKVTPYFNGCAGAPITFQITIIGVIAKFYYENTCANKKQFTFANQSQGVATSFTWNFDDNTPNVSNVSNPVHIFPQMGIFNTSLIVTDNVTGCADTTYRILRTANPKLVNIDTFICRNSITKFEIQDDYIYGSSSYTWNILGEPQFITGNGTLNIPMGTFGIFPFNKVVLYNGQAYCNDTLLLNHLLAVRGPTISFTSPIEVCSITNFNVINTSTLFSGSDSIVLWQWKFGYGSNTQSVYQPLPVQTPVQTDDFTNFPIRLNVRDRYGCVDTLTKNVSAKLTPFLRIFPRTKNICSGTKDTLVAFHSDNFQWLPYPGLSCITCDTFVVAPTASSFIYATAINTLGCTFLDSSIAIVALPFTAAAISNPHSVCVGGSLTLNASPLGKKISWSPTTNISNTSIYNPVVNPTATTKYRAILEDSLGCFKDSAFVNAIINPLPIVNIGPDKIYSYGTNFTLSPIYSNNVVSYNWTPINATLTCTTCPMPIGLADKVRTYTVNVKSDSGCVAGDNIKISISCENSNILLPTAFTPNGDNVNEKFKPTTRGIKTVNSFLIFNRLGQKMFEAKNYNPNNTNIGWDGKFNGELQGPQTFVYLISCTCDSGEVLEKKGTVILLK